MTEKPVPENFTAVWHRGDFSIAEIYTRDIKNGYPLGSTYHRVRYERDEEHQLPEAVFESVWRQAIALCALRPDVVVSVLRNDKESEVAENDNNRPFIMETSPRYFPGAEVKDIVYEGTIYHSDPSEIHRFSDEYMERAKRVAQPTILAERRVPQPNGHRLTRKERKRLKHR